MIYVNKIAKGNETIILKSGFHLSKQPVHSQKAEIAVNDGSKSGDVIFVSPVNLSTVFADAARFEFSKFRLMLFGCCRAVV